jgi:hypothetical protein
MKKILFVGGTYNNDNGAASSYMRKLADALQIKLPGEWTIHNGGSLSELTEPDIQTQIREADIVFWFPDIPNTEQKILPSLKALNPKMMLVTSKNNISEQGRDYSTLELVARALKSKSNLLLEITRNDGQFAASIIDPLANVFAHQEISIERVATALSRRLTELMRYTRVSSESVGDSLPATSTSFADGFFELVREYAEVFHNLIHAVNPGRFLGNASFRCARGFPTARDPENPDVIFVSERNVDKRYIDKGNFVAVRANPDGAPSDPVEFYGDKKPSVDTPAQRELYKHYPNVNFILHSHAYIEGAPFTDEMTPCGAIEEIEDIKKLFPDSSQTDFFVNLRGHGSLALVSSWEKLKDLPYVPREVSDGPMRQAIIDRYCSPTPQADDLALGSRTLLIDQQVGGEELV